MAALKAGISDAQDYSDLSYPVAAAGCRPRGARAGRGGCELDVAGDLDPALKAPDVRRGARVHAARPRRAAGRGERQWWCAYGSWFVRTTKSRFRTTFGWCCILRARERPRRRRSRRPNQFGRPVAQGRTPRSPAPAGGSSEAYGSVWPPLRAADGRGDRGPSDLWITAISLAAHTRSVGPLWTASTRRVSASVQCPRALRYCFLAIPEPESLSLEVGRTVTNPAKPASPNTLVYEHLPAGGADVAARVGTQLLS